MAGGNNRKEIIWNIVNSLLAGGCVFLGGIADGNISWQGVLASFVVAGSVAISKFKAYWESEEKEYSQKTAVKMFSFVH